MRFSFGKNWINYSKNITEIEIKEAEKSLLETLNLKTLKGKSFLDIGCGSGLFSIAAYNLGAIVTAFDYDLNSVLATQNNFKKFISVENITEFNVIQGSVLDLQFLNSLGKYDVYYSWGVLHHTGSLHVAYANLVSIIPSNSILFIAIYNDQGVKSKLWWLVKYLYNKNILLKYLIIILSYWYFVPLKKVYNFIKGKKSRRGMNLYYDMIDWIGGFPFETETESNTIDFFKSLGFEILISKPVGDKLGCNEFVFIKK